VHAESGFSRFDSGTAVGDADCLGSPDPTILHVLLDAIPARVIVVDRGLRYRYANAESLDLWGLTADHVAGRSVLSVIGSARLAHYQPLIERVFGGDAVRWEGWFDAGRKARRFSQEHFFPIIRLEGRRR
jgi:PAS domain-containing protein